MTNQEIILRTATLAGIFSEEFIEKCLASGRTLPLHTYKVWKDNGYQVKRGEKGFPITIWNHKTRKMTEEELSKLEIIPEEGTVSAGYYQKKAYFFTINQVEKIEKEVI